MSTRANRDGGAPIGVGLTEISNILWRQRRMLDLLLFKLEEEQLLLRAGKTRWLADAAREVETVLEEVKRTELNRSIEVQIVADELGLGPDTSLRELSEAAPEPWRAILDEHRSAFAALALEIECRAEENRRLLGSGARAVLDLDHDDGERAEAGNGSAEHVLDLRVADQPVPSRADAQLSQLAYSLARAVTDRGLQPSLLDFLR